MSFFIGIFKKSFWGGIISELLNDHPTWSLHYPLFLVLLWAHKNIPYISLSIALQLDRYNCFDYSLIPLSNSNAGLVLLTAKALFCVLWLNVEGGTVLSLILLSSYFSYEDEFKILGVKPWLWHFVLLTCLFYW